MSRVWKRFLFKIGKLGALAAYVVSAMVLPSLLTNYLGYGYDPGITIGVVVFIFIPIIAYIIYDLYKDAKYEVEQENCKMINTLKGGKNDHYYY